jgi:hypothetical protein
VFPTTSLQPDEDKLARELRQILPDGLADALIPILSVASSGRSLPYFVKSGMSLALVKADERRYQPVAFSFVKGNQGAAGTWQLLNAEAQAFRFLGRGKALDLDVSVADRLSLRLGTSPGLAIFDTCYADPSEMSRGDRARFELAEPSAVGVVVLSNPLPLEIEAVQYGSLNAFQLSYLALDEAPAPGRAAADAPRARRSADDAVDALVGFYGAPSDDQLYTRILLGSYACAAHGCAVDWSNYDVLAWDRITLALRHMVDPDRVAPTAPGANRIGTSGLEQLSASVASLSNVLAKRRDEDDIDSLGVAWLKELAELESAVAYPMNGRVDAREAQLWKIYRQAEAWYAADALAHLREGYSSRASRALAAPHLLLVSYLALLIRHHSMVSAAQFDDTAWHWFVEFTYAVRIAKLDAIPDGAVLKDLQAALPPQEELEAAQREGRQGSDGMRIRLTKLARDFLVAHGHAAEAAALPKAP